MTNGWERLLDRWDIYTVEEILDILEKEKIFEAETDGILNWSETCVLHKTGRIVMQNGTETSKPQ